MERLSLVVGLGKTGLSIARYLKAKGEIFSVFDTRGAPPGLDAFQREFPDVSVFLKDYPEAELSDISRLICSPGVPLDIPLIQAARQRDILVEGDINCFAKEVSAPVVAITGTNGKSTVTCLLGEMAKAAGRAVCIAGNIGTPVLDCLNEAESIDLWVLELSSFQLDITHALKPLVATFLNLSDDHLDRHHDAAAYCAAKHRVYRGAEVLLFNRDDPNTYPNEAYLQSAEKTLSYGKSVPKAGEWGLVVDAKDESWLAFGEQLILPVKALGIQGIHNALNAKAALALAKVVGLPMETSLKALKAFTGLPHRCQEIREIKGVKWINDSKGTNVGSTQSAIQGLAPLLKGKLILIAGGQGKGADFRVLRDALRAHVRFLVLIGEDAALLEDALGDVSDVIHADSMADAVHCASAHAQPGDAVLFSPACASFDWFRDFNHRGEVFAGLVEAL
jgi:UDP-N-acetylmuramoylalanine--D-glutamate ligase